MSQLQLIETTLQRAARRRRLAWALRGFWIGLFAGSVLWLVVLGIYKLRPIPDATLFWTGVVALVCPLIGFLILGWNKPALPATARWLDVQQNLKERLSTALEVGASGNASSWGQLVVNDAAAHVGEIDPRRLLRFALPKAARWAVLVLVVAVGLGFVPEYRSKAQKQKEADAKVMKEIGKHLADLTRRDIAQRKPVLGPTQKSLESVSELGDKLQKASLTRSEALKDLANATDKLKEQLKELGKDPGLRKLEQAARSPGGTDSQKAAGLQKQIESMQKQLGDQAGKSEALDKLQKDLERLQEAAKGMADKTSAGSEAERQKLSASLSALSQQAQQMGLNLPQLDEAIEALAANQTDRFIKDLDAALTDLEKLNDMAKQLQALQTSAEKLGKDLAEQLKNGQADAAQMTLEKLSEQLKSAKLSPEQLQRILAEVSDAIKPASEYGKVGECLSKATGQMKSGDKTGASQSLADAAKELEKLMQEMGDAQSLMAALNNLDQASMCIGTCQGWGMCKRPGMGPGGKPGSGVGTWADDDQGDYTGEWTGRWDNTGMNRPDMDPRGITERDQTLNDALTPDKVKGQFSQGGPMPSITLKGVSIKGTSNVQYEEAATAAQADAQSALSQEKVPRAYQGAVKDYFDDLKK
jgi:predicted  nucleic acid-binding Zn-ribbon protein